MEDFEEVVTGEEQPGTEPEEQLGEEIQQQTPEEDPKVYSEKEFTERLNKIMGERTARSEAKIRRESDRKYGPLMEILRAGTGKESVEDITEAFRQHYKVTGVQTPQPPKYGQRDLELLAKADADEIIGAGDEEVTDELERLQALGSSMTDRERAAMGMLQQHKASNDRRAALERLGVTADTYNSKEFREFAKLFDAATPIEKVWETYAKVHKKEYQTMGSMKQQPAKGPKDYYTPEEIERLTDEELDDPRVWEAVRRSMTGR